MLQGCELQVFDRLCLVAYRSGDNTVKTEKIGEPASFS